MERHTHYLTLARSGRTSGRILHPEVRRKTIPFKVGLGGGLHEIEEVYLQIRGMRGFEFDIETHTIEEIRLDERGKRIDVIIGAIGMEKWGLIPDPKTGSVDLIALRKWEFTGF